MSRHWVAAVQGVLWALGLFFTCIGLTSAVVFVMDHIGVCVR